MTNEPHSDLQITKSELTEAMVEQGGYWAILDATDTPVIPPLMEYDEVNIRCLYQGEAEQKFAHIAPYLVELDANMLTWLREHIWEEPWGIAFQSKADMETIRYHFRKFIIVRDEAGKLMYFRFYDPRVLPTFLKGCSEDELKQIYGPVNRFLCKEDPLMVELSGEEAGEDLFCSLDLSENFARS